MGKLSIFLYAVLAPLLGGCVYAQDVAPELPKAQLIEAVATMESSCEFRLVAMDRFFGELNNNPSAQGYVVVYPRTNPKWMAKSRANEVRKYMGRRGLDASRVTINVGGSQGDAKTEFWIVPMGAGSPEVKETDGVVNGSPMEQVTEPKNFTEENPDGCLWGELFLEEYATEMNWGWEYPGRIVVHAKNLAAFQKRKRELAAELAKYDVAARRLTFVQKLAIRGEEWVELWILPVKKGAKPTIELPPGM